MYKRILMAYDGSEAGQHALLECQDLMQWTGAALTLVAVMPHHIDFIGAEGGFYDPQITEREKENYKRILDQGLQVLSKAGFAANGEVLVGETISEITNYAAKIEADLIVVGHKHLDSWAARWWRGSSSSALIEQAHCSVLVAITK
ncbi:MAG: universal stress protein [Burkholderiaceae bacterium]|nr:universal stress protein [Rhodoferax sp.]MCZ4312782.1 universal stress protein [Comamonadaceae bacterium G21597-S1]MCB2004619.1 universal stress protein [Rhodoferax sp.]MCB2030917.1 universal stress protein [Rhodoferax sp.]MCB2040296.1 universal stress protein [Rhodoferax sp.]